MFTLRTDSGAGSRVEAIVTESLEERSFSHAGVSHQDDLEEAIRSRRNTFLLGTIKGNVGPSKPAGLL